jgi:hypothetical protein
MALSAAVIDEVVALWPYSSWTELHTASPRLPGQKPGPTWSWRKLDKAGPLK